MDKVKWGLRAVSFACILMPLLYVIAPCILTGDFSAAFLPPELRGAMASMSGAGDLNSTLTALGISPGGFTMPQFKGLTFNESTGIATLKLNVTNPLARQRIVVNQLRVTVRNGTRSFTVQLKEQVVIEANRTGVLSFQFTSTDPDALESLVNIINFVERPDWIGDLEISNLYVDANGIIIQASDLGRLSELLGGEGP